MKLNQMTREIIAYSTGNFKSTLETNFCNVIANAVKRSEAILYDS